MVPLFFLPGSYMIIHYLININENLHLPFIIFSIIAVLLGQGSSICYSTAMSMNMNNFKFKDSSLIVSLLSLNASLGPSVFAFYKDNISFFNTQNFYFFLSLFLALNIIACLIIFKSYSIENEDIATQQKSILSLNGFRENEIVKFLYRINGIICISFIINIFFNYFGITFTKKIMIYLYPILISSQFLFLLCKFKSFYNENFVKEYLAKFDEKMCSESKSQIVNKNVNNENEGNKKIKIVEAEKELGIIHIPEINGNFIVNNLNDDNSEIIKTDMGNRVNKKLIDNEDNENYENNISNVNYQITEKIDNFKLKNLFLMFLILFFGLGSVISNYNNLHYIVDSMHYAELESLELAKGNKSKIRTLEDEMILRDNNNKSLNEHVNLLILNSTNKFPLNETSNLNITNNLSKFNNISNTSVIAKNINEQNNVQNIIYKDHNNITEFDMINKDNNTNPNFINEDKNITLIINEVENIANIQTRYLTKEIKKKVSFYVIIYFSFTAITRLFSTTFLQYLIKKDLMFYHLLITNALGFFSQFLGIFMNKALFGVIIGICGCCHGFFMTFLPIYVNKFYPAKNFGFIIGLLTSGGALGSLINSNILFVYYFKQYGILLNEKSNFQVCREYKCFSYSYITNTLFFFVNLNICYYFIYSSKKKINF